MLKKACVTIAALLPLMAVQAKADAPAAYNCDNQPSCEVSPGKYGAMSSPTKSKFNLSIGGFVKLDYTYNSEAVGAYFPAGPAPAKGTPASQKDETLMTARQSRIWFKADGPTFLGAKTAALIEGDFFGYSSLSNEYGNFRMRHAYASMDWKNDQLLFGQFWDVFGPVGGNTLDLRQSGHTGAPAAPRVPQIRYTHRFDLNKDNAIKFVVAAENPVQDSPNNAGAGTFMPPSGTAQNVGTFITSTNPSLGNSGAFGAVPNAAGQLVFSSKVLGSSPGFWGMSMNPLQVGLFGTYGTQKFIGNKAVPVSGYGAFTSIPILKSADGVSRKMTASFEASTYMAQGLAVQGANQNGTIGTLGNYVAPRDFGYIVQASFWPTHDVGVAAGVGRRGTITIADTPAGSERYSQLLFANVSYDLNAAFRIAAEYEHDETHYNGIPVGGATSNYGQINTGRFCVMYFF